jgi:hypothetical protein
METFDTHLYINHDQYFQNKLLDKEQVQSIMIIIDLI